MAEKRISDEMCSGAAKFLMERAMKVAEIRSGTEITPSDIGNMEFHGKALVPVKCIAGFDPSGKMHAAVLVQDGKARTDDAESAWKLMSAGILQGGVVRQLTADELVQQFSATGNAKVYIDYPLLNKEVVGMVSTVSSSVNLGIIASPRDLAKAFNAQAYGSPLHRK